MAVQEGEDAVCATVANSGGEDDVFFSKCAVETSGKGMSLLRA